MEEPVSPASEINQDDEFFDALQTQKLQHARSGSRSTNTTTITSANAATSLLTVDVSQSPLDRSHRHIRPQHSANAARIGSTVSQGAAQYRDPIVPGTWPLAPHDELDSSPTPSLTLQTQHQQEKQVAEQHNSTSFAQKEPVDRYSNLDYNRSGVDVSRRVLCDANSPVTKTSPLDDSAPAVSQPEDLSTRQQNSVTDVETANDEPQYPATHAAHTRSRSPSSSSIDDLDHSATTPHRRTTKRLPSLLFRDMESVQNEDLFLEVADDVQDEVSSAIGARTSWRDKRRSLPPTDLRALTAMEARRPRTSGGPSAARPGTRLDELRSGLRYRQSEHGRALHDDSGSVASFGGLNDGITVRPRRGSRYSAADKPADIQTSSPISPSFRRDGVRSPDMSIFGRHRPLPSAPTGRQRRPSQLAAVRQESEGESPAESSEPKQSQPESISAESQTAPSTVWDELDDLKSRIKKLELTGKLPSTSAAAVGAGSSPVLERPRTATTAPTTIDSSPKRDKKSGAEADQVQATAQQPTTAILTDAHPLLHTALAKAKALLNPALYRTLEATAADALQLASMAGVSSGQGLSSGVSVINGGSSTDRALRRKADAMCRNLTELCLALCDGKHEASNSTTASPLTLNTSNAILASGRRSRMDAIRGDIARSDSRQQGAGGRPMSRLEARRSSILGSSPSNSPRIHVTASQREGEDGGSVSEQDSTPSQPNAFDRQRFTRASSRLTAPHSRYEDISGDEDPTIRPPSRVGSEFSFRSKRTLDSQHAPATQTPHRSFSLREAFTNRRSSGQGIEGHRELARVASMTSESGRRRWMRESTPPVLEEDIDEPESGSTQTPSQPQQRQSRLASLSHMKLGPRRVFTDAASHGLSVNKRSRHVAVE